VDEYVGDADSFARGRGAVIIANEADAMIDEITAAPAGVHRWLIAANGVASTAMLV
jgi:hypothetical protein